MLRSGTFEAHPYLRLSGIYNSNVLLQPRSGALLSSWIHQVNAGFKTSLEPAPLHRLEADYDLEHQGFTKDPSANNALNHAAGILYRYLGPSGLTADVRDAYVNTVSPPNTERTERLRWWSNTVSLDSEYSPQGRDAFVGLEAAHTTFLYTDDAPSLRAQANRYEQRAGARLGYRVLPGTRVYAAYRRGLIRYTAATTSPSKNNKSHTAAAGLETGLTGKVEGRLEAGLHYRGYDDAAVPGGGRATRTFTALGELRYRPLERTRLTLTARRTVEEAAFLNNRYYVATGGLAELEHALPWLLTVSLLGGVQRNRYPEQTTLAGVAARRRDDVYQARVGLERPVFQDWVLLGASWGYRARFSKGMTEQFNYRGQVAAVTLSLVL